MTRDIETHEADVIVIGAGGAGLSAAISAAEQGADVGVVCKSLLGKAHTVMAEGGIAAALGNVEEEDSWRKHFLDTMKGGWGLNDPEMAELHARESPERVQKLQEWGALFDRTEEGGIHQRPFGGHRHDRLAHVGDRTGLEMIRTLQDRAVAEDVDVYQECTVTSLLKDGDRIAGAFGYWRDDGTPVLFRANAVVLATGGVGKLYRITSNSWEYTADGHAMAMRAGAELVDMAFVQFHPTGMVWPKSVQGTLVTEGVRGEGGVLLNSEGERFMFEYVPEEYEGSVAETEAEAQRWVEGDDEARPPPELLTRDVVARAILDEVAAGRGSDHGGAYLDIANQRPAEFIEQKLPAMVHQFEELAGIDITEEPMEVAPTCHYMMGGVSVDAETQETSVPGLYASGEVAGGLHGANRLGGNSLSDLLVFGNRAGVHAGETAVAMDEPPAIDDADLEAFREYLEFPFENDDDGEQPFALHEELQAVMEDHVGISRDEAGLEAGIRKLEAIRERTDDLTASGPRTYNPGWQKCFDLKNMIDVGLAIAHAALERRESRGAHSRTDYQEPDEAFGSAKLTVTIGEGGIDLSRESVREPRAELQEMLEADRAKETAADDTEADAADDTAEAEANPEDE
jgi:succinate dehydrogenase / fumarate reductase flavoprotein subunit